jgi:hypothetical protein
MTIKAIQPTTSPGVGVEGTVDTMRTIRGMATIRGAGR